MNGNPELKMNNKRSGDKKQVIWLTVLVLLALLASSLNISNVIAATSSKDDDIYIGGTALKCGYYFYYENNTPKMTEAAPANGVGYAYYDSTFTLTLNNFTFIGDTGNAYTVSLGGSLGTAKVKAAISIKETVTINVIGENNISCEKYLNNAHKTDANKSTFVDWNAGIESANYNITFIGDGKLNVTSGGIDYGVSVGMVSSRAYFKDHITVMVTAGDTNFFNYTRTVFGSGADTYIASNDVCANNVSVGIRAYGIVNISEFADITFKGAKSHESYGYLGDDLIVSDSAKIHGIASYGIDKSIGVACQDMLAEGSADVYAAGGNIAIGQSSGIYSASNSGNGVVITDAASVSCKGGYIQDPGYYERNAGYSISPHTSGISAERSLTVNGGMLIAEAWQGFGYSGHDDLGRHDHSYQLPNAGSYSQNNADPAHGYFDAAIHLGFSTSYDVITVANDYEILADMTMSHWGADFGEWDTSGNEKPGTNYYTANLNYSASNTTDKNLNTFIDNNFVVIDPVREDYYETTYVDDKGRQHSCNIAYELPLNTTDLGSPYRQMWYDLKDNRTVNYANRIDIENDVVIILGDNSTLNANQGISVRSYYPSGSSDYYYENLTIYARSLGSNMGTLNADGEKCITGTTEYALDRANPLSTTDNWEAGFSVGAPNLSAAISPLQAVSGVATGYQYSSTGALAGNEDYPAVMSDGTNVTFGCSYFDRRLSFVFTAPAAGTYTLDSDIVSTDTSIWQGYISIDVYTGGSTVNKFSNNNVYVSQLGNGLTWADAVQGAVGNLELAVGDKVCITFYSADQPFFAKINKLAIDGPKASPCAAIGGHSEYGLSWEGYTGYNTTADVGNLYIYGGNINAVGGYLCAGIGGGAGSRHNNGSLGTNLGGNVNIYNGIVNATGGYGGAGIGGGFEGQIQSVNIYGGKIIANGGISGAGIGGGFNSTSRLGASIVIDDSLVYAYGGSDLDSYSQYWQDGIGYGYGKDASATDDSGSFSTSNSVIYTTKIYNYASPKYDGAILFTKSPNDLSSHFAGETKDNVGEKGINLSLPMTVGAGDTLTILKGYSFSVEEECENPLLALASGTSLITNNGTVYVDYGSVIDYNSELIQKNLNGNVRYQVINSVPANSGNDLSISNCMTYNSKRYAAKESDVNITSPVGTALKNVLVEPMEAKSRGLRAITATASQPMSISGTITLFQSSSSALKDTYYNELQNGESNVVIYDNSTFTVKYQPNYFYDDTIFAFSPALPQNSVLTLVDLCDDKAGNVYYYKVSSAGGVTSVKVSDFKKMGTASEAPIFHDVGSNNKLQLVCAMPKAGGVSSASMTVKIKDGSYTDGGINVTLRDYTKGNVTLENVSAGNGSISGTVNVSNFVTSGNVIAVEILNGNDNAASNDPHVIVKLGGALPTKTRNNISFFSISDSFSQAELSVAGLSDGSYKLRISVCENTVAENPMNEVASTFTSKAVSVTSRIFAVKSDSPDDRIMENSVEGKVTFTAQIPVGSTLTVNCYIKSGDNFVSSPNVSAKIDGSKITVTIPQNTTKGIYRIDFVCGDEIVSYEIIVR